MPLGFVLVTVLLVVVSGLSIVRPGVVLEWGLSAYPEFAGDKTPLLKFVRFIGFVGLGLAGYCTLIIFGAFRP